MLCLSDSPPDSARPKNVLGPIRAVLRAARHSVSLKNVLGPIRSSRHSLVLWRLPEKCSWTYRSVYLRPRRVESGRKSVPGPISPDALHPHQTVPNLKNVPGPIRGSLRSLATDDAYRKNVPRPIGNSRQALIESCQPEKCFWSYPELSGTVVRLGHCRAGD